jgi:hypothetical protein
MNKYIKKYSESVNESVMHNGIVLIKGKPKGKNGEQFLFAGHVIGSVEVRPGAVMLFLSDTFYRVILENGRLRGVKISYQSEDSLKDALNFKSPGRISIVRNNNKTPFHWRTLNYVTIHEALASVSYDILGSGYIFESTDNTTAIDLFARELIKETLNCLFFNENNSCIILNITTPNNLINNNITDTDRTSVEIEDWEVNIDVLNISNRANSEFTSQIPRRYQIELLCTTDADYTYNSRPGSYDEPDDSDLEINNIDTEVTSIALLIDGDSIELNDPEFLDKLTSKVSDFDDSDFDYFLQKTGKYLKLS